MTAPLSRADLAGATPPIRRLAAVLDILPARAHIARPLADRVLETLALDGEGQGLQRRAQGR
jgi:hypothetical protein